MFDDEEMRFLRFICKCVNLDPSDGVLFRKSGQPYSTPPGKEFKSQGWYLFVGNNRMYFTSCSGKSRLEVLRSIVGDIIFFWPLYRVDVPFSVVDRKE